jgi:hypothetical protein
MHVRRKPITLHDKTEAVVQDTEHLPGIAARADVLEAIRQGLDDVASGRTRPAREVFSEIRRKHAICR